MEFLDKNGTTILADEMKGYVSKIAVAKEDGKGLSTNDYTTTEKNKLSNLNETVLTKLGESADGNLTFDDKEIGANIMVDKELSDTSTNPLQNKVVKSALDEKLSTSGDSKDVVSSFSSNDSTSETTIWTDVPALNSSEKHSSIFNKISTMFKNIRYLYKMLGTADISSLGEGANIGTVTGAISKLNSDLIKTLSYKGDGFTDFDQVKTTGLYLSKIATDGILLNAPPFVYTGNRVNLFCVYNTGYAYQFAFYDKTNQMAYRTYNLRWNEWKLV